MIVSTFDCISPLISTENNRVLLPTKVNLQTEDVYSFEKTVFTSFHHTKFHICFVFAYSHKYENV